MSGETPSTTVPAVTVDRDLARKLSRAERKVREASAAREQLIREAVKGGGSYREVADLAGVSHQTVSNIVRRP